MEKMGTTMREIINFILLVVEKNAKEQGVIISSNLKKAEELNPNLKLLLDKKCYDEDEMQIMLQKIQIKELKKENFCYICGSKENITLHHLDYIHSKFNKKPKINGLINLCENCHKIIEDVVNKGKSKKLWYRKGYEDGQKNSFEKGKSNGTTNK